MAKTVVGRGFFYLSNGVTVRHEISGEDTPEFREKIDKLREDANENVAKGWCINFDTLTIRAGCCIACEIDIIESGTTPLR